MNRVELIEIEELSGSLRTEDYESFQAFVYSINAIDNDVMKYFYEDIFYFNRKIGDITVI